MNRREEEEEEDDDEEQPLIKLALEQPSMDMKG